MDKNNSLLTIIAIIAVGLALTNLGITINKVGDIREITGFATAGGTANLSIITLASVSFNVSNIDWGAGSVDEGPSFATMDSEGAVIDGNWTAVSQGLMLRNDGNCNVTFTLTGSNVAASFIGGTSPAYDIKLTDNETGACASGLNSLTSYTNVTGPGSPQTACTNMSFEDSRDALDIDVNITIPEDALSGAKGSVLTATANCL